MPSLRYVVLQHSQIDVPHYDLMIELAPGSDLATWRGPHWPPEANDEFTPLPLHRRHYLQYEGPISDNRGKVLRVASGIHRILENSPVRLVVCLDDGRRIELPHGA
ncbi:MAG: hypothetical protein ABSB74_09380 [Tepidisphaeraceae bacterium]